MENKDWKKLKKWVIWNIETDLQNFTYPIINKVTEKNIKKAIEQNKWAEEEGDSCDYSELQSLKEDLEIFRIINERRL